MLYALSKKKKLTCKSPWIRVKEFKLCQILSFSRVNYRRLSIKIVVLNIFNIFFTSACFNWDLIHTVHKVLSNVSDSMLSLKDIIISERSSNKTSTGQLIKIILLWLDLAILSESYLLIQASVSYHNP
jgi:hypothetical protein